MLSLQKFFKDKMLASEPHCLALHTFPGEDAEDLAFKEGDLIRLLEHVSSDWLRGSLDSREGVFPASFGEIIKDVQDGKREKTRKL